MKQIRKVNFVIFICLIISTTYLVFYSIGKKQGDIKTESNKISNQTENLNSCISRIDFPLIDICFDDKDSWLLVNYELCDEEFQEKFQIITDSKLLECNKEYLSVYTFAIGRGTTPNGRIVVYKNGEWFKEVQYIGNIIFYSDELKNAFENCTKDKIKGMVGEKRLPNF